MGIEVLKGKEPERERNSYKFERVGCGGLHQSNVFVDFVRADMMLIHLMHILPPGQNL